jgi:hypothetical protein
VQISLQQSWNFGGPKKPVISSIQVIRGELHISATGKATAMIPYISPSQNPCDIHQKPVVTAEWIWVYVRLPDCTQFHSAPLDITVFLKTEVVSINRTLSGIWFPGKIYGIFEFRSSHNIWGLCPKNKTSEKTLLFAGS